VSEGIIEAEFQAGEDGLCLGHIDNGGVNGEFAFVLDADSGGEVGEFFELLDILVAAVGVAGKIGGVDSEEDVECAEDFRPGEGIAEENGVAGGDVGEGNLSEVAEVNAVFGDVDIEVGQGGAADTRHIDGDNFVLGDAKRQGDFFCGFDFAVMPLAISEGEGVEGETHVFCYGEGGGGIEAAA